MPLRVNTQSTFGFPTPRPVGTNQAQLNALNFQAGVETKQLKTQQQKRTDALANFESLWETGKLKDADYLNSVQELTDQTQGVEREQFEVYNFVAQQGILKNKLDTEFTNIQKKVVDKSISAKEAHNDISQLGVQAATAGLENLAARYFLQASVIQKQLATTKAGLTDKAQNKIIGSLKDIITNTFSQR